MTSQITSRGSFDLVNLDNNQNFKDFSTSKPFRAERQNRRQHSEELSTRCRIYELERHAPELITKIVRQCHLRVGNSKDILAFGCTNKQFRKIVSNYATFAVSSLFDKGVNVVSFRKFFIPRRLLAEMKIKLCQSIDPLILIKSDIPYLNDKEKLVLVQSDDVQNRLGVSVCLRLETMGFIVKQHRDISSAIEILKKCGLNKEQNAKITQILKKIQISNNIQISNISNHILIDELHRRMFEVWFYKICAVAFRWS